MSPNPVQLRARGARDPRGGVGMIWNAAQMNFFHLSIRNRLPHKRSAKSSRFRSSRLRIKKERKMTCCGAVGAGEMLPGAIRGASDADRTHAGAGAGGGTRETTPPRAAPQNSAQCSPHFSPQHGQHATQLPPVNLRDGVAQCGRTAGRTPMQIAHVAVLYVFCAGANARGLCVRWE